MLEVWVNAFIPRNVPGRRGESYTRLIERGTHAGKTAVPLPWQARPVNWKDWDAGYLTDQRGFSSDPDASVRMQSMVKVGLDGLTFQDMPSRHTSSGTYEVDMKTGSQLGYALADMSGTQAVLFTRSDHMLKIWIRGGGTDPLVRGAAEINYGLMLTVALQEPTSTSTRAVLVSLDGKIDEFPAFEAYARLGAFTETLFQSDPPAGNTVLDLLGPANRQINGTATLPMIAGG